MFRAFMLRFLLLSVGHKSSYRMNLLKRIALVRPSSGLQFGFGSSAMTMNALRRRSIRTTCSAYTAWKLIFFLHMLSEFVFRPFSLALSSTVFLSRSHTHPPNPQCVCLGRVPICLFFAARSLRECALHNTHTTQHSGSVGSKDPKWASH